MFCLIRFLAESEWATKFSCKKNKSKKYLLNKHLVSQSFGIILILLFGPQLFQTLPYVFVQEIYLSHG